MLGGLGRVGKWCEIVWEECRFEWERVLGNESWGGVWGNRFGKSVWEWLCCVRIRV